MLGFLVTSVLAVGPMMNPGSDFSMNQEMPEYVEVNNRVLLKIGGKPITVMDVVRKMDLLFHQQYAEYAGQPSARFQFYTASWRTVLRNVIDDYLIMADAEEKKIDVSEGEIREEMERAFGPDVVFNIDKVGISFDEAWDLIKTDLIVQKMTGMMVHSKAISDIHPIDVRRRYEKMVAENPPENKWVYQVVSLRAEDDELSRSVGERAHNMLAMQHIPLEMVRGQIEEQGVQFSLSAEYVRSPKEISNSHRSVLEKLENGTYSAPVSKRGVSYIFYLKEFKPGEAIAFQDAAGNIKQEIIQERINYHSSEYRDKLRKHYALTENYIAEIIPEETQPFALR